MALTEALAKIYSDATKSQRDHMIDVLETMEKCGGPGGTMGPCPGSGKPDSAKPSGGGGGGSGGGGGKEDGLSGVGKLGSAKEAGAVLDKDGKVHLLSKMKDGSTQAISVFKKGNSLNMTLQYEEPDTSGFNASETYYVGSAKKLKGEAAIKEVYAQLDRRAPKEIRYASDEEFAAHANRPL